jgi:hypothetical protein
VKTYIYVDGFNLYYGAIKNTPYKWLDIPTMCSYLLPNNEIVNIKYFTARVTPRRHDPGQQRRQELYLRALATSPIVDIVFGRFLTNKRRRLLANGSPDNPEYAEVWITEEKGSDVNLATHLVADAFLGYFQAAAVITNDSDLVEPIRVVQRELGLPVGVINPHKKRCHQLTREAAFFRQIREGVLAASQFPPTLSDGSGIIRKPESW